MRIDPGYCENRCLDLPFMRSLIPGKCKRQSRLMCLLAAPDNIVGEPQLELQSVFGGIQRRHSISKPCTKVSLIGSDCVFGQQIAYSRLC